MSKINSTKVLDIYGEEGKLRAVKYIYDNGGGQITDCVKYLEGLLEVRDKQSGTITWFRCAENQPPSDAPKDESGLPPKYLTWAGPEFYPTLLRYFGSNRWEGKNPPIYWAHINLPTE